MAFMVVNVNRPFKNVPQFWEFFVFLFSLIYLNTITCTSQLQWVGEIIIWSPAGSVSAHLQKNEQPLIFK